MLLTIERWKQHFEELMNEENESDKGERMRMTAHIGCFENKARRARLRWFGHVRPRGRPRGRLKTTHMNAYPAYLWTNR